MHTLFCLHWWKSFPKQSYLNIRYLSKYDAEFFELNSSTDESDSEVESEEEDDFDLEGDELPEHDEGEEQQSEEEAANMP